MFQLDVQLIVRGDPSTIYPIYLHEQSVLFQLDRLQHDKKHEILTKEYFEKVYFESTFREHKLLCKLYAFNFFL